MRSSPTTLTRHPRLRSAASVIWIVAMLSVALSMVFATRDAGAASRDIWVTVAADTVVKEDAAGTNFGWDQQSYMRVSPQAMLYMRFDVQGVGASQVTGARLRLYVSDPSKEADLRAFRTAGGWDEFRMTWNNRPALEGQIGALPTTSMEIGKWVEVSLSQAITRDGSYSVALATNSTNSIGFHTRNGQNKPQLVLTVQDGTPAPTAVPTAAPQPPASLPTATLAPQAPTAAPQAPTAVPPAPTAVPTAAPQLPAPPATLGSVYYVSKSGNGADGRSWGSAWNELDKINWSAIRPGDTILIDGGASEMRYTSSLTLGVSGTADKPISIRRADEPGRNGKIIIFGGRSTPLPYCNQTGYSLQQARSNGISTNNQSWVIIDGRNWRGITVVGHNGSGVRVSGSSTNLKLRNMEIYDNGSIRQNSDGTWIPDQKGVQLGGTNITFERLIVHDNGQDAFQSGGSIKNITIRQSWLYNSRTAPNGEIFNRCRHQDGIQVYGGGTMSGMLIEESIFGPGLLHGTIMGQTPDSNGNQATMNDVTIRNTLFYKAGNVNVMGYPGIASQNWVFDRVTSYRTPGDKWHNVMLEGGNHKFTNSVFVGGYLMSVSTQGITNQGNCQAQIEGGVRLASSNVSFANIAGDDYTVQGECAGKGSSITSAKQLLSLPPTP